MSPEEVIVQYGEPFVPAVFLIEVGYRGSKGGLLSLVPRQEEHQSRPKTRFMEDLQEDFQSILTNFGFAPRGDHYILCIDLAPLSGGSLRWKLLWSVNPQIQERLISSTVLQQSSFFMVHGLRNDGHSLRESPCWTWDVPEGTIQFIFYAFVAAIRILPLRLYSSWNVTIIPDDGRPLLSLEEVNDDP